MDRTTTQAPASLFVSMALSAHRAAHRKLIDRVTAAYARGQRDALLIAARHHLPHLGARIKNAGKRHRRAA